MGCLFEVLFEIIFEIVLEAVFTLYTHLMSLLVPGHQFGERLRKRIKNIVTVFAVSLFLCAFIGFFLFLQPPSTVKTVGAYMLFIPLGIMGLQILAGIIRHIAKAIKKHN